MKAFTLLPLLVAALATGCSSSSQSCTLVGCSDGVGVVLTHLTATHSANLPLDLQVCLGAACSQFHIDKTGAAPVCTPKSAGNTLCTIDGQGTVVLTKVPLPAGTADGASIPVHVTATDKTGATVADGTQTTTITASQPNGPGCDPTCHEGQVALTL